MQGSPRWGHLSCPGALSLMGTLMEPCGVQVAGTVLPQFLVISGNSSFCLFTPPPPSLTLPCSAWFYCIDFIGAQEGKWRSESGCEMAILWQLQVKCSAPATRSIKGSWLITDISGLVGFKYFLQTWSLSAMCLINSIEILAL